jgi:hypothetical protein
VLRNDLAELKRLAEWIEGSAGQEIYLRTSRLRLTLPRRSCRQYHHAWRRKRRTVGNCGRAGAQGWMAPIEYPPTGFTLKMRQKATYAPQQTTPLFDHLVGAGEGGTSRPSEFELVINLKTAKARFLCEQDFQGSKTIGAAGRAANRPRKTPPRG